MDEIKASASNMTVSSQQTVSQSTQDVVLETDKLIIMVDKDGMYGDAAPSQAAPHYLQQLLGTLFVEDTERSLSESFDSTCSRTYEELEEFKMRVQEEERLSRMYKLRHTFSLRFDNRAWLHPHGTNNFDYKAIPEEKKKNLEKFKNRVRQENYEYLSSHPEIEAVISLATKRLLQVLPQDPIKFLTEFFTTRMGNMKEFEESVVAEEKKISKYHVNKMRAAGQINIRPSTAVRSEISGESWRPEQDANHLKKMNIGALAQDFSFDASSLKVKKKKSGQMEQLKLNKKSKKKPKKCGPKNYCGCKDWKLKKNRENSAVVEITEQEDVQSTTFSTLGIINDDLLTSAEEDEDEEEEQEDEMQLGDGAFLGEMEGREEEHGNLTTEDAEMIAGLLVEEFFGGRGSGGASEPKK